MRGRYLHRCAPMQTNQCCYYTFKVTTRKYSYASIVNMFPMHNNMPFHKLLSSAAMLLMLAHPVLSCATPTVDDVTKEKWIDVSSANFRIVTEQPEKVARQMVIDLENLRYVSNRLRGATSLEGPPLTIVAVGKENADALQLSKDIKGIFQLSRSGYAAIAKVSDSWFLSDRIASSRDVFLHEYHHFLLMYCPEATAYPLWYNEGMSEYWSSMQFEDGKVWFGDPSHNHGRERDLFDRYGNIFFETRLLFSQSALHEGSSAAEKIENIRFYSRARFAIHYFNSTPELRRQLAYYLRLYNMGLSQEQAVTIAFKRTFHELDAALRDYVVKGMVRHGFDVGPDGLDLPKFAVKVTPIDRAAAIAVLADVVPHFIPSNSTAIGELVALNLAANPDDPNAHALALELAPGQITVREALDKVAELEQRFPNNPRLLALHADLLAPPYIKLRASGAKGWEAGIEQARGLYRRSIAASAFNPRAYSGLGALYAAVPELGPVDEGIAALDTATIYERHPQSFRALADLYLRKKQLRPALLSIRSAVAFNTKGQRPFDVLLLENLELLTDLTQATPTEAGLKFKSGSTYTGPVRDGKPEGSGTWLRPDGSSYTGEFKDGVPSGHGTLKSERGAVYDGSFVNGFATGRGNMTFLAGKMTSYEGEVVNATPQGKGVLKTFDGRLVATFRDGVALAGGTFTPDSAPAGSSGKELADKATSSHNPPGSADGEVYPADACKNAATLKPLWCDLRK